MRKKHVNFDTMFVRSLKNHEKAAAYLNAELEEGDMKYFLIALRYVIRANGGMSKLSRKIKQHRVSLYKMLSENGNPELSSLISILHALGFQISIDISLGKKKKHRRSQKKLINRLAA